MGEREERLVIQEEYIEIYNQALDDVIKTALEITATNRGEHDIRSDIINAIDGLKK